MIKKCICKHEYQDKKYGQGNRVHNPAPSKISREKFEWVCTVCKNRK